MIVEKFDLHHFNDAQVIDALTCPVNRDMTRREHDCDDWALYKNPGWLLAHYIMNGGADEFRKRRKDFTKIIELSDVNYQI